MMLSRVTTTASSSRKSGASETARLALSGIVARTEARPTDQSYELFDELSALADVQIEKLENILKFDLLELNKKVEDAGIPAVIINRKK